MKELIERWNPDIGLARCTIKYTTKAGTQLVGIGIASCHPEDAPYMSKLTGGMIANYRAEIDLIKQINNYEIKPEIAALKHVLCTMRHSKKYNPDSYEATRLKKELAHRMDEYDENKAAIKDLYTLLNNYIKQKDEIHKKGQN